MTQVQIDQSIAFHTAMEQCKVKHLTAVELLKANRLYDYTKYVAHNKLRHCEVFAIIINELKQAFKAKKSAILIDNKIIAV